MGETALVAPEVAAAAGNVARPTGLVPFANDLAHLPGEHGWLAGLKMVYGLLRNGEVHMSALARRHGPVFRHQLGPSPVVCVADADHIWTMLRNEDQAFSHALPWYFFFAGLDEKDPLGPAWWPDFDAHRDLRRILQPTF